MQHFEFAMPYEVCSRSVSFDIDNGLVRNVQFEGGCPGNTYGISMLIEGMPATEAVRRLKGILCGSKRTSCPDQLAKQIELALMNNGDR